MGSYVDVHARIRVEDYKLLNRIATAHDTTVGALVGELTRRGLAPRKSGRPSKYTPELGARILEARRLLRSWKEISQAEGLAYDTAQRYAARAADEQRAAEHRTTTTEGHAV